jgi:ABC-2 type transport system permease protein
VEATPADLRDFGGGEPRELRGPSAIGSAGWWRFFRLLWITARAEFQLKYEQPILGYAWSLLGPLLLAGVLYLAFTRFIKFGGDIPNYPLLLIMNIMFFEFFRSGVGRGVTSFLRKQNLTRKVEFPLLAVPLSSVLAELITLMFNMVVVFSLFLIFGVGALVTWLLFPVTVALLAIISGTGALLLGSLYIRIRDLAEIWSPFARVLFYASPTLIPVEFYPPQWHFILYFNPLAPVFAQARVWFVDPSAPTYADAVGGEIYLLIPLGVLLIALVCGIVAFRRLARRGAEM